MPEQPIPTPDPEHLDIAAVVSALRGGRAGMNWLGEFLPATYTAPERFHRALFAYATRRTGGYKSRPDEGYTLYHDTIGIHAGQRRRAVVVAATSGDQELTFASLHQRSAALATAWAQMGVAPGKAVALVMPMTVEYVVALAACLRLGVTMSVVSPDGPTYVQNRLARLEPEHVVTTDKLARFCGDFLDKRLPVVPPSLLTTAPSHGYGKDDAVLRVISPFGDPEAKPIEISAGALFPALLTAGLFVLALDDQDTFAAPGFSSSQFQPSLLLATLAAGATYAEIAEEDAITDSKVIQRVGTTVLGIRRALRDAFLARGAASFPKGIRAWFRSLTEKCDIERWISFQNLAWERRVPGFALAASTAASFVHLFSPPAAPDVAAMRVWPAPGARFTLAEIAAGALPSLRDSGVYVPLGPEDKPANPPGLPAMIFAREKAGYVFAGSVDLGHDAHAYPSAEVSRVVETVPAVRHAAVIVTAGKYTNDAVIALLIFTDDHRDAEGRVVSRLTTDEIRKLLLREMGPDVLPDRIEFFPLRPRIVDGQVDLGYCRDQYLGGLFHHKANSELHLLISRLGYILAGPRAAS